MKRNVIYIVCLVLTCWTVSAQEPQYWQLTDDEGLASMEVYYLFEDSKGYMWMATDKGLCRYDGLNIRRFSHPYQKGNAVTRVLEDDWGRIWFKAFSGQLFYIDEAGECQLFPIPKELNVGTYFSYVLNGKELCLATNQLCIYNFEEKTWTIDTFPEVNLEGSLAVSELTKDNAGNLLFVTTKNKLWTRKGKENQLLAALDDFYIPVPFAEDSIVLALYDFKNRISIASTTALKEAVAIDAILKPQFSNVSNEKRILTTCMDKNHAIWVGTTQGVYGLKRNQFGWEQRYHLLPNEQVSWVVRDKEGSLWVSTLQNGVYIIPSLEIDCYKVENSNLTNDQLNCLEVDSEDKLLIGGSDGVVMRFDPMTGQLEHSYVGKRNNVLSIVFDKKREAVYFETRGLHVAAWKGSSLTYLGNGGTHNAAIYKDDILLLGKNAFGSAINLEGGFGIDSLEEDELPIPYFKAFSIRDVPHFDGRYMHNMKNLSKVKALLVDELMDSQIWVSANDSLFVFEKGKKQVILNEKRESIIATDLYQDVAGSIWCTTINQGVYQIKNNQVLQHYDMTRGLPSNSSTSLTGDGANIWVGTDKGIVKISSPTQMVEVFNRLDGLVSDEIRDIEVVNGQVWAATIKGLVRFNVNVETLNKVPPSIEITTVFLNKQAYDIKQTRDFLYYENDWKFTFQTTALKGRNSIRYEYRLLGLDSLWISLPSATNFVQFQGLIAGTFTFEVRAVNEDGLRSVQPASYSFSIQAPFWKQGWFVLLMLIIVFLVFGLLAWWRYQIYKKEKELESSMSRLRMQALQSQMNPHFVFNAMSAIQDYWITEDAKTALIYHAKFAKLMRLIFAYSKKISIHIEEEIEFLRVYISLEQIRFEDKIDVFFEVEDDLLEQEIYLTPLLIQPQVENCFKHAFLHKEGKGKLVIRLQSEQNYVYCAIQDDGVGRQKAAEHLSWRKNFKQKISSLDITQERLDLLNASFGKEKEKKVFKITDLQTQNGHPAGTLVEMWIPKIISPK